jgi:glutaminyl-tRNA synthetase
VLENCVREELDANAPRRMGVINPLKLVLTNLAADHAESLDFPNHPKNEAFGRRTVQFSNELWIERDDFLEEPVKGFHRLVPGGEVRLRGVGIIRCDEIARNAAGEVVALHCSLDAETRSGCPGAERKVKGTIHWVDARSAIDAEVRLYDRLFDIADPDDDSDGKTYRDHLNPGSRRVIRAWLEAGLADAAAESVCQLERLGYFVADRRDHSASHPVFNRVVTLRDTWAKVAGK